jgi:hypothetical protein
MKLGAEPRKVAILGALILAGGYSFYSNVLSTPSAPSEPARVTAAVPQAAPRIAASEKRAPARKRETVTASQQFRPSMRPRRPEDRLDLSTIDPTLRLDLLAKVQASELMGGERNLFQFGAPPPPPQAKIKEPLIVPKTPAEIQQEQAQSAARAAAAAEPPKPPPIALKYYGFSTHRQDGRRRAFFLDGDEILVAAEGDLLKRRYKVVRINLTSVVMEDTELKNQQTLPLTEEAAG